MPDFPCRPLDDGIIVEIDPIEMHRRGLLHLPMTSADARGYSGHLGGTTVFGTVLAVGPGERVLILGCDNCGRLRIVSGNYWRSDHRFLATGKCIACDTRGYRIVGTDHLPMAVKVGDKVAYPHRAGGQEFMVQGKRCLFMNERQYVMGVVEEC